MPGGGGIVAATSWRRTLIVRQQAAIAGGHLPAVDDGGASRPRVQVSPKSGRSPVRVPTDILSIVLYQRAALPLTGLN